MIHVKCFPNNPFQENTYLIYDEDGNTLIVDPGMYSSSEEKAVADFIGEEALTPIRLLNTHCHVDHVLGNRFIYEQFGLLPEFHEEELGVLSDVQVRAPAFGLRYELSPVPEHFLSDRDQIALGDKVFEVILAPGHSPAHLCFYQADAEILIGGDVLFRESIGRTDLPGGNHQQLLENIRSRLFVLPEHTRVFPGHGRETTIGYEKKHNPFLR